jgi:hypothetical protein
MKFTFKRSLHCFSIFSIILLASCGQNQGEVRFKPLTQLPKELITEGVEFNGGSLEDLRPLRRNYRKGLLKRFKLDKPQFKRLKSGKLLPQVGEAATLSQMGRPRVPLLRHTFQVPPGSQARVVLENPEVEISDTKVNLAHSEKPLVWGKRPMTFADVESGKYYPGKLFEAHQSQNEVHVTLYPVQVEKASGKVVVLSAGQWKLEVTSSKEKEESSEIAPALIITSEKFKESAKELQKFHQENLGVKSDIQTVEEIDETETPVDLSELPDGYKNPAAFKGVVKAYKAEKGTGYNFELSRKIIHFLKSRSEQSSQFKYVILLGNSEVVPPSYYFSMKEAEFGNASGVTDQCYSAGKMCLEPKLAVGRLPFQNEEEVNQYLKKVKRWFELRNNSENELSLYGGRAFQSSPVYIGELGTLQTLAVKEADWGNVGKHFQTDKKFSRSEVLSLISGEDKSALVYYLDHGTGNRWYSGEEYITSRDVMEVSANPTVAPPIMVSVACINAAFDEALLLDDTLTKQEHSGYVSVGTALLKSSQGAIAYLGGARDGLGSPEYEVDDQGNVEVLGTTYGLQMFDGFIEKHRAQRGGRIGDRLLGTLHAYAFENGNDMKTAPNRWTYLITELLGDPLLPLPEKTERARALAPAESAFKEFETTGGVPKLFLGEKLSLDLPVLSTEARVEAKVFELKLGEEGFTGERLVKTVELSQGENPISLKVESDLNPGQQYVVRLINKEGVPREKHVVFTTSHSSVSKESENKDEK